MIKLFMKNKKGFTLVELMVVVVIIGILTAIAIPIYNNVTANANNRAFEANHRVAVGAIQSYMAAHDGTKPAAAETFATDISGGIASLAGHPAGSTYTWDGTTLTSKFAGHADITYAP